MPGPVARPSGGFRPSFGSFQDDFGGEHMENNAMQAAMGKHQQQQQVQSSAQQATGGSALNMQNQDKQTENSPWPTKPRAVGDIKDEPKYLVKDVAHALWQFVDLNILLGINTKDDPKTQGRKRQTLSRWQKLNQEQQSIAQRRYKEEMQKKQREEQERQMKKRQEEQKKQQTMVVPKSVKKGPVGPSGSRKQKAAQLLESERKASSDKTMGVG